MNTQEVIDKLIEIKPYIEQNFSVTKVGLFGSYSDGSYNEESDIDILVEFAHPIGWKFFTLENYLEQTFNRKIDLVTFDAIKEQLRPFILSQMKYI